MRACVRCHGAVGSTKVISGAESTRHLPAEHAGLTNSNLLLRQPRALIFSHSLDYGLPM